MTRLLEVNEESDYHEGGGWLKIATVPAMVFLHIQCGLY